MQFRQILTTILIANALLISGEGISQNATIQSQKTSLKTYSFDDPDPVPILGSNPKIYPYFKYDGYEQEGTPQDWNIIHLENDFVEVWVLPEAGGKVWGAREKASGEEFIYRNEVMKFRNIAMRGPWTSGGIEFNFGIIGHHPSTATPVDYTVIEEEDGSVSCWVGNMDLSSRTQWRVKINLPKDKAYFETQALWYNPSAMHQSYYNWMTAAAFAQDDLEFYCPGNQYVEHNGDPHPWPNEYGRNIAKYKENNFGSSKSYHVVGEYNDFFGGYFHNSDYGFGHWSPYDEMPGQKLWLWSLARNGGIWEDLLTDTDGQYIEFQAGRLFDQYSPGGGHNPITQAVFSPHTTDQWREVWFPVKEIGGLTDVSTTAVLHVEQQGRQLVIGINALEAAKGDLKVFSEDKLVFEAGEIELEPMGVFEGKLAWPSTDQAFTISVEGMDLHYDSDPSALSLKRPFNKPKIAGIPKAETYYRQGIEWMDFREFAKAESSLLACLAANPAHLEALASLGELRYRQGLYDKGLESALTALSIDTYHPYANYVAGILFQAKRDYINALEMLGWAARSMEYRSAAYGIMGEISLAQNKTKEAIHYATKALDFNRHNVLALQVLAVAYRVSGDQQQAEAWVSTLLQLDPLCHFARFEHFLLKANEKAKGNFTSNIRNEIPYQSYLEVALTYVKMGQKQAALQVLDLAPKQAIVSLWQAYLKEDPALLGKLKIHSPDFVFPFRSETLAALEWAKTHIDDWKLDYYLALNYWGKDRIEAAAPLFDAIGESADYVPFYLTRAQLKEKTDPQAALSDLQKALSLQPKNWRSLHQLSQFYHRNGSYQEALKNSKKAYALFPENYTIGMDVVRDLIYEEQYSGALQILEKLEVLPFEGASESRRLYEWAHLGQALAQIKTQEYKDAITTLKQQKEWPERLGVGKPFDPDERLTDYLLAYAYAKDGQAGLAQNAQKRILDFTRNFPFANSANAILGFQLMDQKELKDLAINFYANKQNPSNSLKWALTKAQGNEALAQAISDDGQQAFSSKSFAFLQQALGLK